MVSVSSTGFSPLLLEMRGVTKNSMCEVRAGGQFQSWTNAFPRPQLVLRASPVTEVAHLAHLTYDTTRGVSRFQNYMWCENFFTYRNLYSLIFTYRKLNIFTHELPLNIFILKQIVTSYL